MNDTDRAPITLLAGALVRVLGRLRRQPTPLSQAEDEMTTLYFLLAIVGVSLGLPAIRLEGRPFDVAFVLYGAVLAYIVGTGLPLQLLLWNQVSRKAASGLGWRIVCPAVTSALGALIVTLVVAAT